MDKLLKRVEAIAAATSNKEENPNNSSRNDNIDDFIQFKRDLSSKIREIRNCIKDRNEYANFPGGCPDKIELNNKSAKIQNDIKMSQNQLKIMRNIVKNDEKMMKSQDAPIIQNRYKICDLIDAHLAECENWSKGLRLSSAKEDPLKQHLLKGAKFNDEMINSTLEELQPTDPTQTELEDIDNIEEWQLQIQKQ